MHFSIITITQHSWLKTSCKSPLTVIQCLLVRHYRILVHVCACDMFCNNLKMTDALHDVLSSARRTFLLSLGTLWAKFACPFACSRYPSPWRTALLLMSWAVTRSMSTWARSRRESPSTPLLLIRLASIPMLLL